MKAPQAMNINPTSAVLLGPGARFPSTALQGHSVQRVRKLCTLRFARALSLESVGPDCRNQLINGAPVRHYNYPLRCASVSSRRALVAAAAGYEYYSSSSSSARFSGRSSGSQPNWRDAYSSSRNDQRSGLSTSEKGSSSFSSWRTSVSTEADPSSSRSHTSDTSYLPRYYNGSTTGNGSVGSISPSSATDDSSYGSSSSSKSSGPPELSRRASSNASVQTSSTYTKVTFRLKFKADFGQSLRVLGSSRQLGGWSLQSGMPMEWTSGDIWTCETDLPAGQIIEYKYVVIGEDGRTPTAWQSGGNSVLALLPDDAEVDVYDNWDNQPAAVLEGLDSGSSDAHRSWHRENQPGSVVVTANESSTREEKLRAWAGEMGSHRAESRSLRMQLVQSQDELRAVKSEVAALRLEMQAATQARLESEARRLEADKELATLHRELHKTQLMLKATMEEALRLLKEPDSDEEDEELLMGDDSHGDKLTAQQAALEATLQASVERRAQREQQQQQQQQEGGKLSSWRGATQQEEPVPAVAPAARGLSGDGARSKSAASPSLDVHSTEAVRPAPGEVDRQRQAEARRWQAEVERREWAQEMEQRRQQQEEEEARQQELERQRRAELEGRQRQQEQRSRGAAAPEPEPWSSWRAAGGSSSSSSSGSSSSSVREPAAKAREEAAQPEEEPTYWSTWRSAAESGSAPPSPASASNTSSWHNNSSSNSNSSSSSHSYSNGRSSSSQREERNSRGDSRSNGSSGSSDTHSAKSEPAYWSNWRNSLESESDDDDSQDDKLVAAAVALLGGNDVRKESQKVLQAEPAGADGSSSRDLRERSRNSTRRSWRNLLDDE